MAHARPSFPRLSVPAGLMVKTIVAPLRSFPSRLRSPQLYGARAPTLGLMVKTIVAALRTFPPRPRYSARVRTRGTRAYMACAEMDMRRVARPDFWNIAATKVFDRFGML